MPSFFAPGLQGLPPTPPHILSGGRMEHDQPFYLLGPSAAFPPRYPQNGCDFIEQYSQSACYSKPMNSQSALGVRNGRDMVAAHSALNQPMFGPLGTANVLPPIRNNVQLPPMESAIPPQYRRQEMMVQPEPQRKEEKATGGVAAHLDYEMDQMSDFVAEMAQGMYALYITKINLADIDLARSVYPGSSVPPQFRKYVYQILSSTRLPSSTILLGLYYLASRMRMLSSTKVFHTGSGQVYRMLTVALLLGSKFLDDNTFQNKSWAEVSNIPVSELNSMELEWLFAFEWKIHDRIYDQQDGFASWLSHWETWRTKTVARAQESRHALAPIDTNVSRSHRVSKPLLSPEGPIPPQYQRSTSYETSWLNPAASEYSPPSAPHTGPNTPDYYAAGPWYTQPPPPYSRTWVPPPQQYIPPAPRSQPPSYHHTPAYALPFAQSVWTGHGSSCGCLYCAKHMEHYMCANPFGSMQPIVAG
ncbi:meiotically up-regulated gene 80 protein [Aspergillus awamori]|uniref:Cyclin-like protein n=2 Tax=Aspergillus TaxID=5052 RepID=A0A3F3Q5X0_9EURO|nr:hypothetical protein BDQ94DRAFT_169446 [Aspergillus welwitschiae]GCB25154.1 meiotically up-regulated gene 80 protein [Aspergillus awamori]GKZ56424.1 hypothetical protein AnigIFM49718_001671 [Aspergillus niger]RDH34515.1 hypothetical protein BDQ94DRAFT_169446 [Aspergillus welwitschiae]GKZ71197.1 hypothetical protein AnigIFM50267_006877 [Aspergillus niger]GLA08714.1 hypothetical protein AnigIFM60653_010510 [Aspergillus niger]